MLFTHEISDNLINDHDIGTKYKAFPIEDVKTKKKDDNDCFALLWDSP